MKIALIGNPNSGKTTLFNELTGLNQKIGNWPGVTVEKKEGKYFRDKAIEIIDLPGSYSLNAISEDEKVTSNFIKNEKIDAIINVVESINLERSLSLTLQLLELNIPVVLALNMQDELALHGITLNVQAIEKELYISAVQISARKKHNLDILVEKAVEISKTAKKSNINNFIAQGQTEEQKAEYRRGYIKSKIDLFRIETTSKAKKITEAIDRIVLNRWLAFPIFAAIIWLMYFVSIQSIGALSIDGLEWLFNDLIGENLRVGLLNIGSPIWVTSLLVDGIISGVGSVLAFIPQIAILFLFITFLEGCGYMSRVAIIMDRLFKKLGLSGKSFIPMIVGCGCSVPAIMSAKTVENEQERKTTMMLTPFIPCSAKLPVFALIAGALFPNNSFVAPSMYFLGILMVVIGGLILKLFRRGKSNDSLILELPHYRLPKAKNVLLELWEKTSGFIIRAGTIIVPAAIILWFLQTFNFSFQMVDIQHSMLASIGKMFSWIFAPLGFGNWQVAIAVITGMLGKELVVATFGIILGGEGVALNEGLVSLFSSQAAAYAFMAFILLAAPCIAAIAATKREMGGKKWMFITIGFQCGVAYVTALIINQIGNLWIQNSTLCISIIASLIIVIIFALSAKAIIKNRKRGGGCSKGCSGCKQNCLKSGSK